MIDGLSKIISKHRPWRCLVSPSESPSLRVTGPDRAQPWWHDGRSWTAGHQELAQVGGKLIYEVY